MVNGPWGGYSNGRIPTEVLTRIQYQGVNYWVWSTNPADGALDGVYLEPSCAVALLAMLKLYHDQTGDYLPVNEGYRTYDGQVYWKKQDSRNATPGQSNHGWAKAVDMGDTLTLAQYNWIHANGPAFGFTPLGGAFGQYDYIHYDYSGTYNPPTPPAEEEEDMSYSIVPSSDGNIYVCSLVTGINARVGSPYHVGLLQRYKKNNSNDNMLAAEISIVQGYLTAIRP